MGLPGFLGSSRTGLVKETAKFAEKEKSGKSCLVEARFAALPGCYFPARPYCLILFRSPRSLIPSAWAVGFWRPPLRSRH